METTILAYIAGFLDGDGSIFFQIVPRKDYRQKFQIRSSIAFYQKSNNVVILNWLKEIFGAGYIRHRKEGISDFINANYVFKPDNFGSLKYDKRYFAGFS